ncbi:MAG: hypothetical protein ICV70_05265 [Jiangellaceae bacterium]|nr:hypothetical protein [Jiangellaceae bacterium]
MTAQVLHRWRLQLDGPPMHGACALVLPVRTADHVPAVLKLTWPHDDAREEDRALAVWDGNGAVRLLAVEPQAWVMLLERLDASTDLSTLELDRALTTIGELLRRLGVAVDTPFTPVDELATAWMSKFAYGRRRVLTEVPRQVVEAAAGVLPDLLGSTSPVLLHTDLHFENVLAGHREPWLAIDPKPRLGDAAYEVAPSLWNRWLEATHAADLGAHLRRRADLVAEVAGLDRTRVTGWVVVREAVNALDALHTRNTEWRAISVAVAEAFLPRLR